MYISYLSDENTMFCFACNELVRKVTKKTPRELVGLHEVNLSCSSLSTWEFLHHDFEIVGFQSFHASLSWTRKEILPWFWMYPQSYTKYIEDFGFNVLPPSLYLNVERLLSFEKNITCHHNCLYNWQFGSQNLTFWRLNYNNVI